MTLPLQQRHANQVVTPYLENEICTGLVTNLFLKLAPEGPAYG